MKKFLIGLFLLAGAGATLSSCKDESKMPAPTFQDAPVIYPQINPNKSFINFDSVRAANVPRRLRQEFEFTLNPTSERSIKINAVEVYKSYQRVVNNAPVLGPRVLVGTYTSFPAVVRLNYSQLLDGLQRYNTESLQPVQPPNPNGFNNLILVGDAVVFTFEYITPQGRIVLTPLNSIGAPTGTFANPAYAATAVFRRAQ